MIQPDFACVAMSKCFSDQITATTPRATLAKQGHLVVQSHLTEHQSVLNQWNPHKVRMLVIRDDDARKAILRRQHPANHIAGLRIQKAVD